MNLTQQDADRFWSLVNVQGPAECWEIRNRPGSSGYVHLNIRGVQIDAHRIAYTLANGPVPDGHDIHHTCPIRNKKCCNPAHLEAKTPEDHAREPGHVADIHASKTHCPQGHEYTEANTYRHPMNGRQCRECMRTRSREYQRRRRTQATA